MAVVRAKFDVGIANWEPDSKASGVVDSTQPAEVNWGAPPSSVTLRGRMTFPKPTSTEEQPVGVPLSRLLREKAPAIVNGWVDKLRHQSASSALPTSDLKNSMREFVEEIAGALEEEEGAEAPRPAARARQHGEQRFRLGYNIDGLIREYGALREVLFEFMEANGVPLGTADALNLSRILIEGIASAAAQYSLERDAKARRDAAAHVGFLAHELRNPLQSAQLRVEMMKRRSTGPTPGDVQAFERALRLLRERVDNELFDVQLHAFPEPVFKKLVLRRVLDALADDVAPQGAGKDVEILVDADPELEIVADERLLDSALSNLVRNAVKFSAPGATVRLRTKHSVDRVVIEVEDQCGGLPEGAVEKMFSPFVQLGQDRSGFGLGLAISKRAAELHGGGLRVHDVPGQGCVFVLDLPLDPAAHLQELEKRPSA